MLQCSMLLEHLWDLHECFFWFDILFDVDGGPNLWGNFGHNSHIYANFQLHFLLHTELPEQLTLDNNDSTVGLNRVIFRAALISC